MICSNCGGDIDVRKAHKALYEDGLHTLNIDILCPYCLVLHCALIEFEGSFFEYDPFDESED